MPEEINLPAPQDVKVGDTTYHITGATPPPPPPPPPPETLSPPWTSIPPNDSIIVAAGKVTVPAGSVLLNGAPMGHSDHVTGTFVDLVGRIWQQSTTTGAICWGWTGTTWAAGADPRKPPVVPPVAGGTARTRLLAYLKSLEGKNCLIGQTSHQDNLDFKQVAQSFGFEPAVMFNDPWTDQWPGNAPFTPGFLQESLAHAKAGGIVGLSLMLPNPIDFGPSQSSGVDPVQLLTPGSGLNNRFNQLLDRAVPLFQAHKDAGNAVLTRFLLELDGGWFWWGKGKFTLDQQTLLFRYIVNYLRVTKGLDNLLTTFATNGYGAENHQYPGDDVTDIVGIDAYTDNLASYRDPYEKLIAQAPTKLFAMTEFGSGDANGVDPNYDLNRLKLDIQAALPRTCYANFWCGWRPNQMANGKAAMSDPFWLNKSQVRLPAA